MFVAYYIINLYGKVSEFAVFMKIMRRNRVIL